jgi:polyisoprenoid-binding protein YceI
MPPVTYVIDPTHSAVHFSVRHLMVSNVRGEFTKVSGTVNYDPEKPETSTAEATIDANSISTRDPQRDGHLKSPDFLDTEKFPTITFRSKKVEIEPGGGKVIGDLTIHGGRPDTGNEGSMGQAAHRRFRNYQAQPQGLWLDVECRFGNRRRDGWR